MSLLRSHGRKRNVRIRLAEARLFLKSFHQAALVGGNNIGKLPRRCRPLVIRTGTHSALHSQSAIPGDLTGAWLHLGISACQAQGSWKLWTLRM